MNQVDEIAILLHKYGFVNSRPIDNGESPEAKLSLSLKWLCNNEHKFCSLTKSC